MKAPRIPTNEKQRISTLDELGIVYSPSEERFDRITRLATRIFNVPIALVSLVTANTQWFKSSQGLLATETPREVSFCGHAILGNDTFIISDTHKNPDFSDNPLVTGEPFIRFYAGHPIRVNTVKISTFCIIDKRPRRLKSPDYDTLKSLAFWVENEVKLSLYTSSQKELMTKVSSLQRKALIDPITGCWNEGGIVKLLYNELDRSRRDDKPVSILMINLENVIHDIREVSSNSRDIILKEIAQEIRRVLRSHDIVGKLTGFQYIVFLSNCEKEVCEALVQRILRNIAIRRFNLDGENIKLGASIGYTCYQDTDLWSATLLMDTAEKALKIAEDKNSIGNMHYLAPKIGGN